MYALAKLAYEGQGMEVCYGLAVMSALTTSMLKNSNKYEIIEDAEQVLAEMNEVRTWSVKFDRIHKARSLPVEKNLNNVIKYENSLERSIFRNLAALKTLQDIPLLILLKTKCDPSQAFFILKI